MGYLEVIVGNLTLKSQKDNKLSCKTTFQPSKESDLFHMKADAKRVQYTLLRF